MCRVLIHFQLKFDKKGIVLVGGIVTIDWWMVFLGKQTTVGILRVADETDIGRNDYMGSEDRNQAKLIG